MTSDGLFETIECKDRAEWHARRREGIGASEAAAILGVSPWKGPHDVWAEKVGLAEGTAEETEAMEWGTRLEGAIREKYCEETGRLVIQPRGPLAIVRSKAYPYLQTTLDGEIAPIDDRGPGVYEGKTAAIFKKEEWAEEPPLQYQIQNQHQLLVTGWTWGADAVLIGGQRFLQQDFVANQRFQTYLREQLEAFWELVVTEQPPPVDGSESATELLRRLFPRPDAGVVIALPPEAVEWDRKYQEIKANLKVLEEAAAELKNRLCAAIGAAEIGTLPSGDSYRWGHVTKEIPAHEAYTQSYRQLTRRGKKGTR
jgi:putative phage-type endonuclease